MTFEGKLCKFITQTNFLEIYGFVIDENDTQYIVQYPLTLLPRWLSDYREMMDEMFSNHQTDFPDYNPVPMAPGFKPKDPSQTPSIMYIPKAGYIMVPMYEFASGTTDIEKGGEAIRQGFIDSIAGYYMLDITVDPDEAVKEELDKQAEQEEKSEQKEETVDKNDIVQTD